jgi:hypothetical protein
MKKTLFVSLSLVLCIAMVASMAIAKNVSKDSKDVRFKESTGKSISLDQDMSRFSSSASQGTTILASYTFDSGGSCTAEGWTTHDVTAQTGDYFHVDDFAGLGGGTYGFLVPLQGNQSMWGGARPDGASLVLCGYSALPGYGNGWNQALCTKACLAVTGDVTVTFTTTWDSEPGYDATAVEIADGCGTTWTQVDGGVGGFDGTGVDSTHTTTIVDSLHSGTMKIRFHFTADGGWSDEDGLWDTDGFIILDDLSVSDGGGTVLANEDFEGETVGDNDSNDWESCTPAGYGDYAAMYPGLTLVLEDPCLLNFSCVWTFYTGSTENYACGGFPAQTAMPKGNVQGQYMSNEIWSPVIPYVGAGVVVNLAFDYYRDLPLDNLQFAVWHIRSFVAGCPSAWDDRNFVYYGGQKDWLRQGEAVGDLILSGATDVQIAVGAVDQCGVWCGIYGTGACHSHAPLIDNIELLRIDTGGPQWSIRDLDLFQDTFSADGTITGTARADMANDILPAANLNIRPGDSTVVEVSDPEFGLVGPPLCYVAVWPQGQVGKDGPGIASADISVIDSVTTLTRFPLVDSLTHDGVTWYCFQMDTAFTNGTTRTGVQPNRFCIDLGDSVFTPCDTVCFVFCAENTNGDKSYWTPFTGGTDDLWAALNAPAEFQVLPGGGWKAGGDVLYVDGMNARGAQPFFDSAFDFLNIRHLVDRYDIRAPSSGVANRPGARVTNVTTQIIGCYRKIIWNTGDLNIGLIGDGTGTPEKSNDAFVLNTFLDFLPNTGGVYFSGDDLAEEWAGLTGADAIALRNFITHNVTDTDHVNFAGTISPNSVGVTGGCFDHVSGADVIVAYGGCALINDFDVLEPTGTATSEMTYAGGPATASSVIGQVTLNTAGFNVGVILSGFSYHYIRDAAPASVPARVEHLFDILSWLTNTPVIPTGVKTAGAYALNQNYPNPFNPTTTIDYSLKASGLVSLKVYNVAGQLVRTLVSNNAAAGEYSIQWDGRDNAGTSVSSGVYFYKLVSGDFSMTKKMVLLK